MRVQLGYALPGDTPRSSDEHVVTIYALDVRDVAAHSGQVRVVVGPKEER